ncbi:GNAT family N-acetyltransferase [Nocardioides sp.]|uniref:GNAT family N-acetyltransferase n=1 Tax=Nocardioides sp. TaxID=35761 RepID=UPI003D0ACC57
MFRIAGDDDLVALRDLERDANLVALAHVYPPESYPYPADDVLARWRIVLDDPDCTTLVHDGASGLDGLVAFDSVEGRGSIRHLAVRPSRWGTGLARALLEAACDRIEGPVSLWCLAENHRARGLYEHLGWQRTGVQEESEFAPYPVQWEYLLRSVPRGPALTRPG